MANALAAIETVPSGATMIVFMTYAPRMIRFCSHIGEAMLSALRSVTRSGRKDPRSCRRFSSGLRTVRNHSISPAVIRMDTPVPIAAPTTPSPSP